MGSLSPKAALLVEHPQNDFVHPEGAITSMDHRHIAEHIVALVKAPGFGLRVATETHLPENSKFYAHNHDGKDPGHIGDIPDPKKPGQTTQLELLPPGTAVAGSWGAQTIDEIGTTDFDIIMNKFTHPEHLTLSSFKDIHGNWHADMAEGALSHDLASELKKRDIETIVVVGCHGEHCVSHTAIDTRALGYRTLVVKDAVVFHMESADKETYWKDLRSKGVEVVSMGDPALKEIMNPK